jgi:hypothetical protein
MTEAAQHADPVRHQAWEKVCEECGGPVHWLVAEQVWVHQSEFSPCVLIDGGDA